MLEMEDYMRRFVILTLLTLVLFLLNNGISFSAAPDISAQAASVIDVNSGRVLYEKNANQKLPIASLTKIMTAIVAIESGNLEDKVKTSKNAVGVEGSSIYLRLGEELTLEDMLYGLMLRSGNDAAVAIAEHIGGSVEGFAYLMNEKAQYIGLSSTNFVNPHGLDHPQHYSTAKDMALLTAYALKNPVFQEIVSTQKKTAPLEGFDWDRKWFNKNKMLRMYPGADGVKTGYTKIAKRCLVSSATKDGRKIAVVVLNDGNDWNDSARLLDYGFTEYQNVELIQKNHSLDATDPIRKKPIELVTTRESIYPLKDGEISKITSQVVFNQDQTNSSSPPAYLYISLANQIIDRVPLIEVKDSVSSVSEPFHELNNHNGFLRNWLLFWRYMF